MKGFLSFMAFSFIVFLIGLALGVYDNAPSNEGWIEHIYHPPGESRRPY